MKWVRRWGCRPGKLTETVEVKSLTITGKQSLSVFRQEGPMTGGYDEALARQ